MPALERLTGLVDAVVCDRREPSPGIVVIGVLAPALAQNAHPGQFVMALTPLGERVATAVAVYGCDGDRASLMLVVVGPRTRALSALREGEPLTLLGPLGNGFDVATLGNDVALVAGGVGIASLALLARELLADGRRVHVYYGARTAEALVDAEMFAALGASVSLATDDGSRGYHGYVTELFGSEARAYSGIAACGPTPMLRAISRIVPPSGARMQLSLEEPFACGVGACWGCVVGIDRSSPQAPAFPAPAHGERREFAHARICTEGPVFFADELRW